MLILRSRACDFLRVVFSEKAFLALILYRHQIMTLSDIEALLGKRSIDTNDDGGANKSSDRLYRRKARRLMGLLTISLVSLLFLLLLFLQNQHSGDDSSQSSLEDISSTDKTKIRWVDPRQVPPIQGKFTQAELIQWGQDRDKTLSGSRFFRSYQKNVLPWEHSSLRYNKTPTLDYTRHTYTYPELALTPPPFEQYPPLDTLQDILNTWPQDEYDHPPTPFVEKLQHFDYNKEEELQAAIQYRELELPFKIKNVPEIVAAGRKWTVDYLSSQFDGDNASTESTTIHARGYCEESEDNFFGFFVREAWKRKLAGPYPVSQNDLTFRRFYTHASYADGVGLKPDEKHFYWQAGVPPEERYKPSSEWSFISLDLPSFSSPEATFFGFNPKEQKGIQCRFGERGVVAATHYDAGRNMIAMMTGAKRYILAPPNQCSKLGILTDPKLGGYRHSYINFGHIALLQDPSMPFYEREWLNAAKDSLAIDTVLKEGEVLYVPSHWFHYIISLQRSAQCNTRSGREVKGNPYFGGMANVETCT